MTCPAFTSIRHCAFLDDPRVVEAMRLMRESLDLLDLAGFGSTSFACHLSFAIESAAEVMDGREAETFPFLNTNAVVPGSETVH